MVLQLKILPFISQAGDVDVVVVVGGNVVVVVGGNVVVVVGGNVVVVVVVGGNVVVVVVVVVGAIVFGEKSAKNSITCFWSKSNTGSISDLFIFSYPLIE